jgi:carboxypeptidase Taq
MLDEYEPGVTGEQIAYLFDSMSEELTLLAAEIGASRHRADPALLERAYPLDAQRHFAESVASAVGFDFHRGRLDTSPHPFFTTLGPDDCRITTRFNLRQFSDGFFGILHEVGHALYEQGLDSAHFGLPMGEAASLGLHESQARLWENTVGRSRAFWRHFFPQAVQVFPGALRDVNEEQFHRAVNHVAPTLIRVRADEVTYNLHILIRFELEQALVAGGLRAADLPAVWNEKYKHYLSVAPANDAEGCLQDGHWGAGLIGYFPTYTLGNLFAAQLFARAAEELRGLEKDFAQGRFEGLLGWLRDRVYRHGHRYSSARLIEQATGSPPDHRPFLAGLRNKYSELYEL